MNNKYRLLQYAPLMVLLVFILCSCGSGSGSEAGSSTTPVQLAATPVLSLPTGTYASDQTLTISCAAAGATIYYTTDGSTPTVASAVYGNPVTVAGNGTTVTIKAIAVASGLANSNIASATITIQSEAVATPTFNPPAGTYGADQSIAIDCVTAGATIYYTTDGSTPTVASAVYGNPIAVAGNGTTMTIKALAVKSGMTNSAVASATYTIIISQTVAAPAFTLAGGTYSTDQSIAINCATAGATIYYTTDGSAPTTLSTLYGGPVAVAGNGTTMTIKALAVKSGMTDSAVASATFTISYAQNVATPTFTPAAGTYSTDQSVAINCTTAGATIYYTTDGSVPTASSLVYSSPIAVTGNGMVLTIKALAAKSAMTDSAVASATFTINASTAVFSYPQSPAGGLIQSSWVSPNGSDQDMYAYNDFTLTSSQAITEVDWRGGYIRNAVFGRVTNFVITFYDSIAGGSEPLVTRPDAEEISLAQYIVGGNAGERLAGVFGGVTMYDYKFVLPTPFQAAAGTKYWIRIEAAQSTYPDWGIAVGTGGDGRYFRFSRGMAMFQMISAGDTSFSLLK